MDSIYLIISQNGQALRILAILLVIFLFYWLKKVKTRAYKSGFSDKDMPANLWFYSQLVNIEIGTVKASYRNLNQLFIRFLIRKYKISKIEFNSFSIFDLVKSKEKDKDILDIYGEIWNSIEDLKHKKKSEVIAYIKDIKKVFNKEDITEWLTLKKNQVKNKPCNDC